MSEKRNKLFSAFKPVATETWEAKINDDLKSKDYEKTLIWNTEEGFSVRPYYRREDLKGLDYLDGMPGKFPFVRGNKISGNDWFVRQNIKVKDVRESNRRVRNILNHGVTSLGFCFDCSDKNIKYDLRILLEDICLETIEINFKCECFNCDYASPFKKYLSECNNERNNIEGSVAIDPIATLILSGKMEKDAFIKLKAVLEAMIDVPDFRMIGVHGELFANSGASIVQELAFALAQGTEYLIKLTGLGIGIDDVAKNIKFNFGVGGNYFMEIAKLRAARLLWANIVKGFNPEDEKSARMIIHSRTNSYNKTLYDPYVNMLRIQTEAMSAALGSADSITVEPFNFVYGETNEFSERIARNQQILLKEESHFDKVVDPGAGSWYIENLTASIAEHAWNIFLKISDMGGFVKAFYKGFIQDEIRAVADRRMYNFATGRESIMGVTSFPDFHEQKGKELNRSYFFPVDLTQSDSYAETLKLYRAAQPFEVLRYKTDIYSLNNKRPVVFILTIGNLSLRRARAQFSCNFFAIAGFEVIDNIGFASVEQGIAAAKAKNADFVVVCSSDEDYVIIAPAVAGLIDNEILVVAGNPVCRPQLEDKGISNFIHSKSNILEELKKYQNMVISEKYKL
jgi:methylmalonyl-CoA mutase